MGTPGKGNGFKFIFSVWRTEDNFGKLVLFFHCWPRNGIFNTLGTQNWGYSSSVSYFVYPTVCDINGSHSFCPLTLERRKGVFMKSCKLTGKSCGEEFWRPCVQASQVFHLFQKAL